LNGLADRIACIRHW